MAENVRIFTGLPTHTLAWWRPGMVIGFDPLWVCMMDCVSVDGTSKVCETAIISCNALIFPFVKMRLSNRDMRRDNVHVLLSGRTAEINIRTTMPLP